MEALQAQMSQLAQQMQTIQVQAQQAEARAVEAETRAALAEQSAGQTALNTSEVGAALASLPAAIAAAAAKDVAPRTLVDIKGLGKPVTFDNKEASFLAWSRKSESYIVSVFPKFRKILTWASEQELPIDMDDIDLNPQFKDVTSTESAEFNTQLHAVLMALTNGESFDLVLGSGNGFGIEAWRRLHRRWDPLTAGRARGLLRDILAPKRVKTDEIFAAVEKLEEQFRRYTSRRDSVGKLHELAEDIRMSSLESVLPEDLERHVQLNRARLSTYDDLRTEIIMYAETRTMGKLPRSGGGPGGSNDMDVDSLWKKGGKGDKGGKGGKSGGKNAMSTKTCYHCGKQGHYAADCWSRQAASSGGAGSGRGGGKGGKSDGPKTDPKTVTCYNCGKQGHYAADCRSKPTKGNPKGGGKGGKQGGGGGRGKGKGANSLEEDPSGEPEAELQAFDICGVSQVNAADRDAWEKCDGDWLRLTLDTGAAASVWPRSATYGEEVMPGKKQKPPRFRTATGELITAERRRKVRGRGEWGQRIGYSGWDTDVRKPLIAAGEVTGHGSLILLTDTGGHVIGNEVIKQKLLETLRVCLKQDSSNVVPVHKEGGVFNMYVKLDGKDDMDIGGQSDDDAFEEEPTGFPRQGRTYP